MREAYSLLHGTPHTALTQYIPGIIATVALLMINCVRKDELMGAPGGGGGLQLLGAVC